MHGIWNIYVSGNLYFVSSFYHWKKKHESNYKQNK